MGLRYHYIYIVDVFLLGLRMPNYRPLTSLGTMQPFADPKRSAFPSEHRLMEKRTGEGCCFPDFSSLQFRYANIYYI